MTPRLRQHFDTEMRSAARAVAAGDTAAAWLALERARRMVFITGGAYTPAAKEFLETVSNARVEKPFDSDTLREQVREWVKQARQEAPTLVGASRG